MTLIIVILLLLGYVVIATGHLTGVNKAAIAMFIATVGWVVYILSPLSAGWSISVTAQTS